MSVIMVINITTVIFNINSKNQKYIWQYKAPEPRFWIKPFLVVLGPKWLKILKPDIGKFPNGKALWKVQIHFGMIDTIKQMMTSEWLSSI